MNYWLFKSEPDTWSWDQQVAKGVSSSSKKGVNLNLGDDIDKHDSDFEKY